MLQIFRVFIFSIFLVALKNLKASYVVVEDRGWEWS